MGHARHGALAGRSIALAGVVPTIGGLVLFWALYKSVSDGINPNPEEATVWLGHFSAPVIIGAGFFLLGFVLMFAMHAYDNSFWRRKPEVAPDGFFDAVAKGEVPETV